MIHKDADVVNVTSGYTDAGVSGISILTDSKYFFGSKEFLIQARKANPNTPILRKDFIFDEYQIIESKAIGADAILLICAVLTPEKLKNLAKKAKKL